MSDRLYLLLDVLIGAIPKTWITSISFILAAVSLLDVLDISLRVAALIVSAVIGWYAVKSYKAKIRVDEVDRQIKEQQLAELIRKNQSAAP